MNKLAQSISSKVNNTKAVQLVWANLLVQCLVFCSMAFTQTETFEKKSWILEQIVVEGSQRITENSILNYSNLKLNEEVTEDSLIKIRSDLLLTGMFQDVKISLNKGSSPGRISFKVILKDDPSVYGAWALGAKLGITYGELQVDHSSFNNPPLSQQFELVSRNLFSTLSRSKIFFDLDSVGSIRGSSFAIGYPRWGSQELGIDFEFRADDPLVRFLNSSAYAIRSQILISDSLKELGVLKIGIADYRNTDPRFKNPIFSDRFIGLSLGAVVDTRLKGFLPSKGYKLGVSILQGEAYSTPPTGKKARGKSTTSFDLELAVSLQLWSQGFLSIGTESFLENNRASSWRSEIQLELPAKIDAPEVSGANWYLKLRTGRDQNESASLQASSFLFGLRFYSSSLIGELALQITERPKAVNIKLPAD